MKAAITFLTESNIQYMATIGLDGKPKVRPFQFMFEDNGKLWFCTSNQKEVFKEIQQKPHIELCASGKDMSWMRLSGTVIFSDDLRMKEKVFEVSPLVKGIYKTPDNPKFEIFYLSDVNAHISSLDNK